MKAYKVIKSNIHRKGLCASRNIKSGEKIAIIKYSVGGTALYQGAGYGDWYPDQKRRNHLDNALATIKNAFPKDSKIIDTL